MKYDLVKFHHWLLVSTFKNKWFEENIKLQIISLLSWFIYPEYRKTNSFFSILRRNKFILSVLLFFIFWTSGFFTFGKLMNIPEKTYEYIFVRKIEEKIVTESEYDKTTRKFIQDRIIEECDLEHTLNFKKLPDDVFFCMINEVTKKEIPYKIFFKIVDHESGFLFIPNNQGSGAFGYCQVMPSTYKLYQSKIGVKKHTPINNIKVGSALLKDRFDYHKNFGHSDEKAWFLSLTDYAGGKDSMAKELVNYTKKNGGF